MTPETTNTAVAARLEETRRRLLDLTRRNRLLNHRAAGLGTLTVAGEHPDEVYRILVAEGRRMQFLSREEAPAAVAASLPAEDREVDAEPEQQTFALAPIDDTGARAEHQTDTRLQTALDGERLQTRLLHLAREAASALEEQGANVLYLTLGAVEWREAAGGVASRAPLVFVPVELARRSVNSRHTVARFDDDVATNPCLVELCKRQFALDLPAFDPDGDEAVTAYFDRVSRAVAALPEWRVTPEIHVGLFSFAKLLMYRDLDPDAWPAEGSIFAHSMVRRLSGVDVDDETLDGEIPDPSTLDDTVSPDECYQVLDADSSQQAAILAAKRGLSAVVEGPPGTGKSQTITNVIAECLSEGKSVLFVSEKAAALEVVKRRLESVGLGDFVLELHSRKASKRAVLDGLKRSLASDAEARDRARYDGADLEAARSRLNEYVRELHDTVAPLGISPFEAISRAVALSSEPEARCVLEDVTAVKAEEFAALRDLVDALDHRLARAGDLASHPWRGAGLTRAGLEVEIGLRERAARLDEAVDALEVTGASLAAALGAAPPETADDVARLVAIAADLAALPPVAPETVADPRWDEPDPDLDRWLASGAERARLAARWSKVFDPRAELADWSGVLERQRAAYGSFARFFSLSWYRDSRAIRAARRPGAAQPAAVEIDALEALVESRPLRAEVFAGEPRFAPIFGEMWAGDTTDWERLRHAAAALSGVRRLVREGEVGEEAARRAATPTGRAALSSVLERARAALAAADAASDAFVAAIAGDERAWYGAWFPDTTFAAVRARLDEATAAFERLGDLADVNDAVARLGETPAKPFVEWALSASGARALGRLAGAFARQFYRLWIDRALAALPALARFRGEEHEALVARFRALDEQWLEASKRRLADLVRSRRPDPRHATTRHSKLGVVQAETKKQRNIMPLRKLFAVAGEVVQAITPCFMMSPVSVAQYLQPGAIAFDVVIFDEASQVEPADAYGAIARGRQLLLVGDERQLPPTNFFSKVEADEVAGDAAEFAATDLESILAVGSVRIPHRCRLRWHYRSRHASLIEFSNERFYDDAPLRVFPSPHTGRDEMGVALRFVEGAEYKRGSGQHNPAEAAAVAAEVVRHAAERPDLSLGVGAFSLPQQRAIQDEVERLRREAADDRVEAFFRAHPTEPFFVKNLETIQGDERDVILLSVGYGPDGAGRVTMNFGPLNRDGGWRRLNVLVTRARERCLVFSSIRADDMKLAPNAPRGVAALKEYLYYAEHGHMPTVGQAAGGHDSPLEADVARALRDRGWEVHAQVGAAGFAIDLAVVDPERPGRYLVGVECDGATYHASATARDRDRLRQSVLERLGWRIHRVWSTDWFYRREPTLARLIGAIESARVGAPTPSLTVGLPLPTQQRPDREGGRQDSAAESDGVVAYVRTEVVTGDHEALVRMPAGEAATVVADVVREEWPVHVDEALRAVAARFATRATRRVQEAFDRGLAAAEASGAVERRGDFLWRGGETEARVRRRGAGCPVVRPESIAPEELRAAIRIALGREFGLAREALVSGAARVMGFARTGPALSVAIEENVDAMLASGEIAPDPNGFLVLRPE